MGKELTVDFAGWSPIWDYVSLNASKADRLLFMVRVWVLVMLVRHRLIQVPLLAGNIYTQVRDLGAAVQQGGKRH